MRTGKPIFYAVKFCTNSLQNSVLLFCIKHITRVSYIDFDKYGEHSWWDFGQRPPWELTIKHNRFENQSEARIIINTDDERIKQILVKPIEIGSLEDIATVSNTYLHGGMSVEITVDLEVVTYSDFVPKHIATASSRLKSVMVRENGSVMESIKLTGIFSQSSLQFSKG